MSTAERRESVIFSHLGEAGLLCEHAPGPLDLGRQRRIWAVAGAVAGLAGIRETIPGMNNLVVLYDPLLLTPEQLSAEIERLWQEPVPERHEGRTIEIPVVYGGEGGVDLAPLAERAGLDPRTFAELHAAGDYTVYALGAQPGFGYLGGLDPRLATPRRSIVHPRIEEGAVMIGGAQTAVQSRTTPSGWHMIGRTETVFFDPERESPCLLKPGDRVRFTAIEVLA
jgi:KipI family sensor histidine kinase inhibitor